MAFSDTGMPGTYPDLPYLAAATQEMPAWLRKSLARDGAPEGASESPDRSNEGMWERVPSPASKAPAMSPDLVLAVVRSILKAESGSSSLANAPETRLESLAPVPVPTSVRA